MKAAAVIFDFDGTLVDTMPLHFAAYEKVFQRHGLVLTKAHFDACVGGAAKQTIPRLLGEQQSPVSVEVLHQEKKRALDAVLDAAPLPVLWAGTLSGQFAGRIPMAIASSGSRPGIEKMLDRLGWRERFAVVVTGEDAPLGKPAPDLFLLAAARLGVDAGACLAFEDTADGLAAATAAGMLVVDVRPWSLPSASGLSS